MVFNWIRVSRMKIVTGVILFFVCSVMAFLLSPADPVSYIVQWVAMSIISLGSYAIGIAFGRKTAYNAKGSRDASLDNIRSRSNRGVG